MAIVVVALLTRIAIPTGYMPMVENGHIAITLCGEQNPGIAEMPAMPGMATITGTHIDVHHSGGHDTPDHDKNGSCGFGGLSLASLAAADPVLLAIALLFAVATVFRHPVIARVATVRFLWPPRTGPPVHA